MITGVILAHNEERNMVPCIQALRPHVQELLLIDTESTDRTRELAEPLVDRILTHPNAPNFDAIRNIAIPEAKFEWMWFVDADERIPVKTGGAVRRLIQERGHEFEAVIIPFKSYFCGQWMQHCGWWPGYTMPRILKRGSFQFAKTLHGGVEVTGRQFALPPDPNLAIDHLSYRNIEHYLEKLNRYTSTEAGQLAARGQAFDWQVGIRHMIVDLWGYYEAHRGGQDGELGWILSWLSGQYRWLSYAKLVDQKPSQQGSTASASIPANLDDVLGVMREQLTMLRRKTPELPLGIVWRSPVWDPSGYADECRTFLKALARGSRPLRLEDIRWSSQECELPDAEKALLRSLTRAERPRFSATITDCIPTTCAPDPSASMNILRTTFETDRIPDYWLSALESYDEIWVTSQHNCATFRRSGVAPEKLRVVPSCVDTERYRPDGPKLLLPKALAGKFVFLSVFDWALRKGWDLLLRAYCQTFDVLEGAGLLIKLTRSHRHPLSSIFEQAECVINELGQSLNNRPDIVLSDAILDADGMAALYRSVDAFVLPSRGEGWGRPYMEAMASGLPAIGTRATGNIEFMDDTNSFLIDTTEVDVPECAAREIPVYKGHRWQEPSIEALMASMRVVFQDGELRTSRSKKAVADVLAKFGLSAGREAIEAALALAEQRFVKHHIPAPMPHQFRVELEGEFFACHSFSKVNEEVSLELIKNEGVALALKRVVSQSVTDETTANARKLAPYLARSFEPNPDVVIRHSYPPNWTPPPAGKWVHIQPWEFGRLPREWIQPLCNRVDEIWAPSNYVKRVYVESGVPPEKIHVIPWGIDPAIYAPEVPARILPTAKQFLFLFVGGTIARKGFDLLLAAYLAEFCPDDDVCLVVKDIGAQSFYRDSTYKKVIEKAIANPQNPQILYLDEVMTEGQLASLYVACHCFAAPYRGEGFGLPVLEAMASGLAVIVPRGGATDDFVTDETGILLPACLVKEEFCADIGCSPSQLEVAPNDLRHAMREAFENRSRTEAIGRRASQFVRTHFTWKHTAALMSSRLTSLTRKLDTSNEQTESHPKCVDDAEANNVWAVCVLTRNSERTLADCLSRITPFADQLIVCDRGSQDRSMSIAREYSTDEVTCLADEAFSAIRRSAAIKTQKPWISFVSSDCLFDDRDLQRIRFTLMDQPPEVEQLELDLRHSRRAGGDNIEGIVVTRTNRLTTWNWKSRNATLSLTETDFERAKKPYGRTETIDRALDYFHSNNGRLIVEVGSIRERGNIQGDGYSTVAWAQHAEKVYTVDIDPAATALTQEETAEFGNVVAVTQDGIDFLNAFTEPIDLLYLDAWDAHAIGSKENHLRAYIAACKNLHHRSLILIDDTDLGDHSKGGLVIPQALQDGWRLIFAEGKQTLLGAS
jgi:glycosyltransferase involved in cell wall biosynthesis